MIFGIVLIISGLQTTEEIVEEASKVTQTPQQVIVREVVKVKIRCEYCSTLYDETLDKCPNCGANQ
jgi:Zn finger protein HypA/HybF involved in hydrogenase expression